MDGNKKNKLLRNSINLRDLIGKVDKHNELHNTAANNGILTCLPVLDILDISLNKAPCICCYSTHSTKVMNDVVDSLKTVKKYFNINSFIKSHSFIHLVSVISRDLYKDEIINIADKFNKMKTTHQIIRDFNNKHWGKICVIAPLCNSKVLWVYSTPEGRKLLRFISRNLRKKNITIKISVSSSDTHIYPRYWFRMYSAEIISGNCDNSAIMELLKVF